MDKHKDTIAQAKQVGNHEHLVEEDGNHDQHLIGGGCNPVDDPTPEVRNTDHNQQHFIQEIGPSLDMEPTTIRMNIKGKANPKIYRYMVFLYKNLLEIYYN